MSVGRLKKWIVIGVTLATAVGLSAPGYAQTSGSVPDLSGLWAGGARNIGDAMEQQGRRIPFTAYGAERYENVDLALNPNGYCLPPGPSRAIVRAGGTMEQSWPLIDAFRVGDEAVGVPVLTELYEAWRATPVRVDLAALWRRLGVRLEGERVVLDDAAPQAQIRRSIEYTR